MFVLCIPFCLLVGYCLAKFRFRINDYHPRIIRIRGRQTSCNRCCYSTAEIEPCWKSQVRRFSDPIQNEQLYFFHYPGWERKYLSHTLPQVRLLFLKILFSSLILWQHATFCSESVRGLNLDICSFCVCVRVFLVF